MKNPHVPPRQASFPSQQEEVGKGNTTTTTHRTNDDSNDRDDESMFVLPDMLQGSSQRLDVDFSNHLEPGTPNSIISRDLSNEIRQTARRMSSLRKLVNDSQGGKHFHETYQKISPLGEGGFATVFRCQHKVNGSHYAVKEIYHEDYELLEGANSLKEEIAAMKCLRESPYIVRLFDVFDEMDRTFLVMEEMEGGDLLDRITAKRKYSEADARSVARSLLQAVRFVHTKGYAHRDIKPENILLLSADDDTTIKLCDFGCATQPSLETGMQTMAGSPQYAAPEVYNRTADMGYGIECDLWSTGVVLFVMLGGYAPFESESVYELAEMVCEGDWHFHEQYWSEVTQAPKDLITALMHLDPKERFTSDQALESEWLKRRRSRGQAANLRDAYNRSSSDRKVTRNVSGESEMLGAMARTASVDNISLDDLEGFKKASVVAPLYVSFDKFKLQRQSSREDPENNSSDGLIPSTDQKQPPQRIPMFWATSENTSAQAISRAQREKRKRRRRRHRSSRLGDSINDMSEIHFVRTSQTRGGGSVSSHHDIVDQDSTERSFDLLAVLPDLDGDDADLDNGNIFRTPAAVASRNNEIRRKLIVQDMHNSACGKTTYWSRDAIDRKKDNLDATTEEKDEKNHKNESNDNNDKNDGKRPSER